MVLECCCMGLANIFLSLDSELSCKPPTLLAGSGWAGASWHHPRKPVHQVTQEGPAEAGAHCSAPLPFCLFSSWNKTSHFWVFSVPGYTRLTACPSHVELGLCWGGVCCSFSCLVQLLPKRAPKFRQLNSAVELIKLFTCLAFSTLSSTLLNQRRHTLHLWIFGEQVFFLLKFPLYNCFAKNRFILGSTNIN